MKILDDIPVISCIGFSKQITEERARELGNRKLILKPSFEEQAGWNHSLGAGWEIIPILSHHFQWWIRKVSTEPGRKRRNHGKFEYRNSKQIWNSNTINLATKLVIPAAAERRAGIQSNDRIIQAFPLALMPFQRVSIGFPLCVRGFLLRNLKAAARRGRW